MKGRRRSIAEREEDLFEVAEMVAQRASQKEIADRFNLSKAQASRDVTEIYSRWAAPDKANLMMFKSRFLAELNALKKRYRAAWEVSQKPREMEFRQKNSTEGEVEVEEDGTPRAAGGNARTKVWLRRESSAGDPSFLNGIRECLKLEARIRGLDDPQQTDVQRREPIKIIRFLEANRDQPVQPSLPSPASPPPEEKNAHVEEGVSAPELAPNVTDPE